MNMDIKLGCYYTLSVEFGMTELKVQDWTLDEAINSLIKKAERNFYSITKEDGIKVNPDSITVTPEYYAFYEDDKSNRCIVDNSDIELYYKPLSPHKMYFHGGDSRRPLSQVLLDKGAECEDPITLTEEQTKKLITGFDELNNLEDVKRIKNHLTELPYQSFVRKIENALSESGFRSPESTEKLKQFIKKEFGVDIH